MSKGTINKVMLLGRIGSDPDIRTTASGSAVANLSVATNHSYKDKKTDEWIEETEWHRVVVFGRTAEVVRDYLNKGSQVHIDGRLKTKKWTDKNDVERYTTEVICDNLTMVGGRSDGANQQQPSPQASQSGYQNVPPPAQPNGYTPPPPVPQQQGNYGTPPQAQSQQQGNYAPPQQNSGYRPPFAPAQNPDDKIPF